MATQEDLIKAILQKRLQEEMQARQVENSGNPFDRLSGISSKVGNFGEGLSETGKFLSNYDSMNKIGSRFQTAGNTLQTGANAVQSKIPTSSSFMNKIGSKIASSLPSSIGGAATSAGVGAGASTGAATAAGTTAAGTAGASAAGGAAAGAGAASAGGAAAGGSAAGGAAAGGPIGWLAALAIMALQGTNRKRAKKSGEFAQQIADAQVDAAKERLNQSEQLAQILGEQNALPTEQPQVNNNSGLLQGDTQKNLIDSYIQSSLPEQTPVAEVANPSAPVEENQEEVKKGFFHNLANGLNDFITGYKDNRENGFKPDNLRPSDSKGKMQRFGEGAGTLARLVQNPVTQGIVAGGLSTALTRNPLYGLGMGYKFYNQKHNSDLYKNILKQQGIEADNPAGIISADDMSKILISKKFNRDFMTRKEFDRMRLENGQISVEEYNKLASSPDYNPDEMININGLNSVVKAGRSAQQNKNDKSKNYFRDKNDGKNVIKVEYGQKPDSHTYTHVEYGPKPESKSTTYVQYGPKPESKSTVNVNYNNKPPQKTSENGNNNGNNNNNKGGGKKDEGRVKVQSPEGKVGTIPISQLAEAIKQGFKKLK